MKKILTSMAIIGVTVCCLTSARAEVPDLIPVQGILTDQFGDTIDGMANMLFAIYDSETGGTLIWSELYNGVNQIDVVDGFFTVYMGTLNTIAFEDFLQYPELWLGITVGLDDEMDRIRLATVPFAEEARFCQQIGDLVADDIQESLDFTCGGDQFLRGWDPDGGPICGTDITSSGVDGGTITDVYAGTGLNKQWVSGNPELSVVFGTTATTVAAGNHLHTGVYQPLTSGGPCPAGQFVSNISPSTGVITCTDESTGESYTSGAGINFTVVGEDTQISVNTSVIQVKLTGACSAGEFVSSINPDSGTFTCTTPAGSDYTPGEGINIDTSDVVSVDFTTAQRIVYTTSTTVNGQCDDGDLVRGIDPATGAITCVVDLTTTGEPGSGIISITALPPLNGGGSDVNETIGITMGTTAGTAAWGDHNHDAVYPQIADTLAGVTCAPGQILEYDGTLGWICAADDDTNTNAATICTGDNTYLDGEGNCDVINLAGYQLDVAGTTCTLGIASIANDGTVTCSSTDANTIYTPGAGISIASDVISVQFAGSGTATTASRSDHAHDHGTLTGLNDDDHTQYFNLSQSETVAGIPAFNGGTSGSTAPFTVDSNYLVTNLNADLLDGMTATDFATAGHTHTGTYAPTSHTHSGADITSGTVGTSYYSAYSDLTAEGYLNNDADTDILTRLQADGRYAATSHAHDHGTLTGLTDDDHPQYFNLSQAEIVTAIPAFNGGTSGTSAPFSVDSTYAVTNLNADLLDGQHAANFSVTGHTHSDYAPTSHSHDHGALTGLTDDDHTQYFNLSQAETVNGIPAFNGGTSGVSAPFTVDSNFAVSNLNADYLDGLHSSSFAPTSHNHYWADVTNPPVKYPDCDLLDGFDSSAFSSAAHDHAGLYVPLFPCGSGEVMKWNGSAWDCDVDLGGTYTEGAGIDIASNEIAVDWAEVQHRVYTASTTADGVCDTGDVVKGVDPDSGEVICVQDATTGGEPGTGIVQVNAISPITGGGNTPTIDIGVSVGTSAGTVAAGNHAHAGVYAPVSHAHSGADITSGTVGTSYYSAYSDLTAEGYLNNDADADILTRVQADGRYAATSHSHDHGAMTGLGDDDHTQYFNLSQSETVAGIPAFNGGTSGSTAPFTVDSNYAVTNLNADLIDGQHASEFAATSHSHDHGAMTGLGDDDHTQYFNLSQNETVAGIPAFNGGTSGTSAPFAVDSTYAVMNLNADYLDGSHASDFAASTHTHAGVYAPVTHTHSGADITSGTVGTNYYSAYSDLTAEGYLNNDADSDILTRLQADGRYAGVAHGHDHGTMTGLTDDDHTQYFNLSQSETVAGIPAFNGGTSGTSAPFSVDSTYVVANLNADYLDGYSASSFSLASHTHDHGAITGLLDDDHTQYFNLSQSETVAGIPAFNGGTSGTSAPFSVDSTYLVTSLNADYLDGLHSSSFLQSCSTCNSTFDARYILRSGDTVSHSGVYDFTYTGSASYAYEFNHQGTGTTRYGVRSLVQTSPPTTAYAGYFNANATSSAYGIYAVANDSLTGAGIYAGTNDYSSTATSADVWGARAYIEAFNSNRTGEAVGIEGYAYTEGATSNMVGVRGIAHEGDWTEVGDALYGSYFEANNYGHGTTYGVYSTVTQGSTTGDGSVYGAYLVASTSGDSGSTYGIRVEANNASSTSSTIGTYSIAYPSTTSWGYGAEAIVSSPTGATGGVYGIYASINNLSSSGTKRAIYAYKSGGGQYAGYFAGDVHVTGTLTKGAISFVQPHRSDPGKEIVYVGLEGPEHAAFIRGTAFLDGGRAVIEMPEHWQQVAAADGITVHLTPIGAWAPLYASSISTREVVVEVAPGFGSVDVEFSYYILCKRDGFQAHEPIQDNIHFTADDESAWMFENQWTENTLTNIAIREMLISNGILNEDLSLNMKTARKLGWNVIPNEEDLTYCVEHHLPCADPGRADLTVERPTREPETSGQLDGDGSSSDYEDLEWDSYAEETTYAE